MKVSSRKFENVSLSIITISAFVAAFGLSVFAQSPRAIIPVERRVDQLNRQIERSERDGLSREIKGKNRNPEDSKQSLAIKAQIKEDFEALQTTYNKIVLNLQSNALERDFVLQATDDIKKSASRLKENLALPKPEENANVETAAKEENNLDDRRKSLRALCSHIYNFITNPIFNEPTGLDIEQAAEAERELEIIINLSEKIKEAAEKSSN